MERVNEDVRNSVAKALNELIGQNGVTEFAKSIDVKRDDVNNWLRGRSDIRLNALTTISRIYNVSVDWVLGLSEHKSPNVSIQGAQELTGLSTESIEVLHQHFEDGANPDLDLMSYSHNFINSVNDLISSNEGQALIGSLTDLMIPLIVISQLVKGCACTTHGAIDWMNLRETEVETKYRILEAQEALATYIQDYLGAKEKLEALTSLMDSMVGTDE